MFAIAVTTPGKLDVVEVSKPTPGLYEARIRTKLAALATKRNSTGCYQRRWRC